MERCVATGCKYRNLLVCSENDGSGIESTPCGRHSRRVKECVLCVVLVSVCGAGLSQHGINHLRTQELPPVTWQVRKYSPVGECMPRSVGVQVAASGQYPTTSKLQQAEDCSFSTRFCCFDIAGTVPCPFLSLALSLVHSPECKPNVLCNVSTEHK